MRSLLALPAALLLVVGLSACDAVGPADAPATAVATTANAEQCGTLDNPCPPASCARPPTPYHDWGTGGGSSYSLNGYLNNTALDESPGNAYYLQHDAYNSGNWTTVWGTFSVQHPTNPDFYVKTVGYYSQPTNAGKLRVKRTCANGTTSYSYTRSVTATPSFPRSWHNP